MEKEKLGKYTLIRQIAKGGMAEIWLAEQRGPGGFNKELVIKRILPHLAEEGDMTKMFFDEARIVAYLTHPNIGQVFELGEHDGDYFIAMEFIDGLDLAELREKIDEQDRTLPVSYGARIICDILQALDYAHNYVDREGNHVGLIHRDISPHNVLISNDGVVKLVDFGVAKGATNTHKTETGAVKGKFAYMAPEQIENNDLDHRVDIFSVGVVFFELLTGQRPFGDDLQAVSKIISEERPDPRSIREDIPAPIVEIINCSLARDREERFATAAEMEQAIQKYLHTTDNVVNTRQLAVMVHQLRGLEIKKPTEQLYGFEKHGVDKKGPRITQEGEGPNGRIAERREKSAATAGVAEAISVNTAVQYGDQASASASAIPDGETSGSSAEKIPTNAEIPSGRMPIPDTSGATPAADIGSSEQMEPGEPRGASAMTIVGFLAVMVGMTAVFGILSYVVLANADASDVVEVEEPAQWKHTEGAVIVVIDADEPADVYKDLQKVGETPFYTYLRPGDYVVELRNEEGKRRGFRVNVEEDRSIQNYRFEF